MSIKIPYVAVLLFCLIVSLGLTSHLAVATPPVESRTETIALPPGFVTQSVLADIGSPTVIDFARDGRMFIAQKDGHVRVFENGTLLPDDFIDISAQVNNFWDRGLLGIAIHPDFPHTPHVYLLFTYDPPGVTPDGSGGRVSRLIRVSADPNNTTIALPGSEVVLLGKNSTREHIGDEVSSYGSPSCDDGGVPVEDCLPADSPSHTIGALRFGKDGSLFVSNGDGAHFTIVDPRALRAQNIDSLSGKLLRIDPISGNGLADNPFYNGDPDANRSRVWSYGLRNPFRFAIDPDSGQPIIGDVGWNAWEEIDRGMGKNFGWPCYEGSNVGSTQQPGYANDPATRACVALYAQGISAVEAPLYAYNHSGGEAAVNGGDFYTGTNYPAQYQGALFITDYSRDWIKVISFEPDGDLAAIADFATDVSPNGGPVQVIAAPDTNLYYVVFNGSNASEIRRIVYTAGGNTPPTAHVSAIPSSGPAPLLVHFSSVGSIDSDAQTQTYQWAFGTGDSSIEANPTYSYTLPGSYTAVLTVTDSLGAFATDHIQIISGNTAPVATIVQPAAGSTYNVHSIIVFKGNGSDVEDGALPGSSLEWEVRLIHGNHVHFDYAHTLGAAGSFIAPDHGDGTAIELCLTLTDSGGLQDFTCVNLLPNTVPYMFDARPSGLTLIYRGVEHTTPFTVKPIINSAQTIGAPITQQGRSFDRWSDGGAATHTLLIGSSSRTLIATYSYKVFLALLLKR